METLCEICQELFDGKESDPKCPRMLSCGHTFCTSCLNSLSQRTSEPFINCPICRQKGSNSKEISEIPVNRAITTSLCLKSLTKSTIHIDEDINDSGERKNLKPDYIFKIISLGDSGTGKTQISSRFAKDEFEENPEPTISLDHFIRIIKVSNKIVRVIIHDTAGSEKYHGMISGYVRGSNGVFFVFDLHDRESFDHLSTWLKFYENFSDLKDINGILIGNKNDIKEDIVVKKEEAEEFANKNKLKYFEGSAKTGENIREAFNYLIKKIIKRKKNEKNESTGAENIVLGENNNNNQKKGWCPC